MDYKAKIPKPGGSGYLDGQLLIAMPNMTDPRFRRAVIFVCAHSTEGAMGLVINRLAEAVSFPDLLRQLEIIQDGEDIELPLSARDIRVHQGGPVETGRGFVLHSSDYYRDTSTLPIDEHISLTATLDILRAIVDDNGPERAVLALGYAGWAPGQLEAEIQQNGWLICKPNRDIVFDDNLEGKYEKALGILGVDPAMLVGASGSA